MDIPSVLLCVHVYIVGILPMPYAPNYCASKHGIVGFTRSMTVSYRGLLEIT